MNRNDWQIAGLWGEQAVLEMLKRTNHGRCGRGVFEDA